MKICKKHLKGELETGGDDWNYKPGAESQDVEEEDIYTTTTTNDDSEGGKIQNTATVKNEYLEEQKGGCMRKMPRLMIPRNKLCAEGKY